jgi:hypothetical protein
MRAKSLHMSFGLYAITWLTAISVIAAPLPTNLDLTSTTPSAPTAHTENVTILVGGRPMNVAPGASVTSAQAAAIEQVLSTGKQPLILGSAGNAVGGSLVLPDQQFNHLVIPRGVDVVRDFSSNALMSLAGNLVNKGTFYAVSTNPANDLATITANHIMNSTNALLTSVLPVQGIEGFENAIHNLSLNLVADHITNAGTISSANGLTLTAANGSLSVNGAGGTFAAANGINLVAQNAAVGDMVAISGGSWLSPTLHAELGNAGLNVFAKEMSGLVSVNACKAQVGVEEGSLHLGFMNITGDPTFFSVGADVTVQSGNYLGPVAFLAGRDVIIEDGAVVTAATADGVGQTITMVAGAQLQITGDPMTTGSVKVVGPFGLGGSIKQDVGAVLPFSISSAGTASGGNMLLVAYPDTANTQGGEIILNGTLNANSANGKAGDIAIIAPRVITLGDVLADGATGISKLTVMNATPTGTLTADQTGKVTGTIKGGALQSGNITISTGSLATVAAGVLTFTTGGTYTGNGGVSADAQSVSARNGGIINITAASAVLGDMSASGLLGTPGGGANGGNGGKINITASAGISPAAGTPSIFAAGGSSAAGTGGVPASAASPAGKSGGAGGNGGNGGSIVIKGQTIDLTAVTISASGADGNLGGAGSAAFGTAVGATGGNGGAGGKGGTAGSVTITSTGGNITLGNVHAIGGGGGSGNDGGAGSSPGASGKAGKGGAGGAGGAGSIGGKITINSAGELELLGNILASGGSGGNGGNGVQGGDGTVGGAGGNGGNGAASGAGGVISITAADDIIVPGFPQIYANAGANDDTTQSIGTAGDGGAGGAGGNGSDGAGGNSGNGGKGAAGAAGGKVTLTSTTGDIRVTYTGTVDGMNVHAFGSTGGSGGMSSTAGTGTTIGGNGGAGGAGGNAGNGGSVIISALKGAITTASTDSLGGWLWGSAQGGLGGHGRTGGNGGGGSGSAGNGGKGGIGGNGGNGGPVTIQANTIDAIAYADDAGSPDAGNGGTGGSGGVLAAGASGAGGNGGAGAAGGNGGKGGKMIMSTTGNLTLKYDADAWSLGGDGGSGGDGGEGTDAGDGATAFGKGGNGGAGAKGGNGGSTSAIALTSKSGSIFFLNDPLDPSTGANVRSIPGAGGQGGNGGLGGDARGSNDAAATAGNGGAGGAGGNAGGTSTITLTAATNIEFETGARILAGNPFNEGSGQGGNGRKGGNAITNGKGGLGGVGGNGGAAGTLGAITLNAINGDILLSTNTATSEAAEIRAIGFSGGHAGEGGAGGDGASFQGTGGNGANSGKGGNAAKGATITLNALNGFIDMNEMSTNNTLTQIITDGGRGGNNARGGNGGGGTKVNGKGGSAKGSGIGGAGGTVSMNSKFGIDISIVRADGGDSGDNDGDGGDAGFGKGGNGGLANTILQLAAIGGVVLIKILNGNLRAASDTQSALVNADGGFGGSAGGNGGIGGNSPDKGGNGGKGATAGGGGAGGKIVVNAPFGAVGAPIGTIVFSVTGGNAGAMNQTGGNGGNGSLGGGKGGAAGSAAPGGAGGSFQVNAASAGNFTVFADGGGASTGKMSAGNGGNVTVGANSALGGEPGAPGAAAAGGKGGTVTIKTTDSTAPVIGFGAGQTLSARGGDGSAIDNSSTGGNGGNSRTTGTTGGTAGVGGKGGQGGIITLNSAVGISIDDGALNVAGGNGGSNDSVSGIGGGPSGGGLLGTVGGGGSGGTGGAGGAGGKGGTITLTAPSIDVDDPLNLITAAGGNGGAGGTGGTGGTRETAGVSSGNGGVGGLGGVGGAGGSIVLKATVGAVDIVTGAGIRVRGGDGGAGGAGGDGGAATATSGAGAGGAGGNGAVGGAAGSITINSAAPAVIDSSAYVAQGGTGGAGGAGGDAGDDTANPTAANGGNGGFGGVGGKGGLITVPTGTTVPTAAVQGGAGGFGGTGGQGTDPPNNNGIDRSGDQADDGQNGTIKQVGFGGSALMAPTDADLLLSAGNARIRIARGSAAFVSVENGAVSLLALHERKTSDIGVLVGEQEIFVRTGEQLVLGKTESGLRSIATRAPRQHRTADGGKATLSEFSIPSAITSLPEIRSLRASADPAKRALYDNLVRNAAVLQTVGLHKGPYRIAN